MRNVSGAVEGASLQIVRRIRCAAKSLRSLRLHLHLGRRGRCGFCAPILHYNSTYFLLLFSLNSPCRLTSGMRLCLKLQGTLSLDPASPLTPACAWQLSLAMLCAGCTTLVGFAHSSLANSPSSLKSLYRLTKPL